MNIEISGPIPTDEWVTLDSAPPMTAYRAKTLQQMLDESLSHLCLKLKQRAIASRAPLRQRRWRRRLHSRR